MGGGGWGGGHPEVDFPVLGVAQEDSDLSAEWTLNDRWALAWHRHESQALTDVKQLRKVRPNVNLLPVRVPV